MPLNGVIYSKFTISCSFVVLLQLRRLFRDGQFSLRQSKCYHWCYSRCCFARSRRAYSSDFIFGCKAMERRSQIQTQLQVRPVLCSTGETNSSTGDATTTKSASYCQIKILH